MLRRLSRLRCAVLRAAPAGDARGHTPGLAAPKGRCRVGREVAHPGPSPEPDKEMSTIRLFRRCGSWLSTPAPDREPWVGQRPRSEEIRAPRPRETLALAATTSPRVPRPLRRFDEPRPMPHVAADPAGVAGAPP